MGDILISHVHAIIRRRLICSRANLLLSFFVPMRPVYLPHSICGPVDGIEESWWIIGHLNN